MMDTRRDVDGVIHLIGPGGAGKSTAAPHIAALLGFAALDLDRLFEAECGCIDAYIETYGYAAYAAANVDVYVAHCWRTSAVFALSSGFMTYQHTVHPAVLDLQRKLAAAPTTVLLLPSLDDEACVAEIVRRQQTRPLQIRRSPAREETVIRERLAVYRRLTTRIVTTMQPVEAVALEVVRCVGGSDF